MAVKNAIYKVDDGKGGFDEINFKTNAAQIYFNDGKNLEDKFNKKTLLWKGSHYLNKGDTEVLSKKLSECANGISLIFSDYDPGTSNKTGNNYNWYEKFVSKDGSYVNSGNYLISIPCNEDGGWIIKAIYVKDDRLEGCSNNSMKDWNDVVLREIWEV
ncbi:hypothetical protein ACFO6R_12760 [Eubacterium multiforme]|uniref:Uncharacterized protein n=1 Tax=Eubacterium multiforme TaxID=83339 RepID=A0ABT9UW55_9FIRM|nr:hypothetical protein [Eubacterium multiforme]MDQ0150560.1 hypothetical protein [Eubacterium multiforme]